MSEHQPSLSDDDGRNVHFFDGSTGDMLGGLFQNGSITQANFIHLTPGDYKIYALPDGGKCYDNRSKEARNPA